MNRKQMMTAVAVLCLNLGLYATAPANYYAALEGKSGTALRTALTGIISSGFSGVSYDGLKTAYQYTDVENGHIVDMYSNCTWTLGQKECGNYSSECDCYNREHSVPQSWFKSASPMKSDIVHVVPTDGKVNGKRSNFPFGEVGTATYTSGNGSKLGSSNFSGYSGTVFEPIDLYKGDFARIYFYMVIRYADKNFTQAAGGSVAFAYSGGKTDLTAYSQNLFLKWHRADAVSEREVSRNDGIYQVQKNRNPFVDYPELVEYIWGDKQGQAFSLTGTGGGTEGGEEGNCISINYSEPFSSSIGDFTTYSVSGNEVWTFSSSYGMLMSGYVDDTKTNYANEDWLVSPAFDMLNQKNVTITFSHALNFAQNSSISEQFTLWVCNDYTDNVTTANWTQLTIPTYPSGSDWTFVSSGDIVIPPAFQTANTRFAFKYISTTAEAATWEIKNLTVTSECVSNAVPETNADNMSLVSVNGRTITSLDGEMAVYDIYGRRIAEGECVTFYQAGVYIVRVGLKTQKVLIK